MKSQGVQLFLALSVAIVFLMVGTSGASAASPPITFADVAGDSAVAPDILLVTFSSPDSNRIIISVAIGNQPDLAPGAAVYVDLNTDQNASTGPSEHFGADYVLSITNGGSVYAVKWDRSRWVYAPLPSFTGTYEHGVVTLMVDRTEIGAPTALSFYVIAQSETGSNPEAFDLAPDRGTWRYEIVGATLRLTVAAVSASTPRSSSSWTAKMRVVRSDIGKDLGPEANVGCAARLGTFALNTSFVGFIETAQNGLTRSFAVCK